MVQMLFSKVSLSGHVMKSENYVPLFPTLHRNSSPTQVFPKATLTAGVKMKAAHSPMVPKQLKLDNRQRQSF